MKHFNKFSKHLQLRMQPTFVYNAICMFTATVKKLEIQIYFSSED